MNLGTNEKHSTALVTGASSGIGLELARLFAADRHNLVLVARRQDRLRALAGELQGTYGVDVQIIPADLADPKSPAFIMEELGAANCAITFLVNNAGFGAAGEFTKLPLERQTTMIQVNIAAVTDLTGRLLPGMLERNHGGILNVASTAAFQPGPGMAVYFATKAYVLSFTEALHEELRGTRVKVSCLAPGPTETEFVDDSGAKDSMMFQMGLMSVQDVARAGYQGLMRGQAIVIPGMRNYLGAFSPRFAPRWIVRRIVRKLSKKTGH